MTNEHANTGIEITEIKDIGLRTKPVFVQDVMQKSLGELLTPHDCLVAGNKVRIYAGTVINLTSFGSGSGSNGKMARHGKIISDIRIRCLDGVTRILPANSPLEIITK